MLFFAFRCSRDRDPNDPTDISYLELYIDFRVTTHSDAPINITTPEERAAYKIPRYELRDRNTQADSRGNPMLATQSRTWTCFIKWAEHQGMALFLTTHKPRAKSAEKFGYPRLLQGLHKRPTLAAGNKAFYYLQDYFKVAKGPNRNLDKPLDIPANAARVPPSPQEIRLTYTEIAENHKAQHQRRRQGPDRDA